MTHKRRHRYIHSFYGHTKYNFLSVFVLTNMFSFVKLGENLEFGKQKIVLQNVVLQVVVAQGRKCVTLYATVVGSVLTCTNEIFKNFRFLVLVATLRSIYQYKYKAIFYALKNTNLKLYEFETQNISKVNGKQINITTLEN